MSKCHIVGNLMHWLNIIIVNYSHICFDFENIYYANTHTYPTNYDRFYLEYLETSLLRYTGEMQDLVGPVSADFTIRSMTCLFAKQMNGMKILLIY